MKLSHQLRRENFTTWFENGTPIFRLPAVPRCFLGTDQETSELLFKGQTDRPLRLQHLRVILLCPLENVQLTTDEIRGTGGPSIDPYAGNGGKPSVLCRTRFVPLLSIPRTRSSASMQIPAQPVSSRASAECSGQELQDERGLILWDAKASG